MPSYEPPSPKMQDGTLCHLCNERPFIAGLTLPNSVPVCRECFDRHVAAENARKAKPKFEPQFTELSGGGFGIVGYNPPKKRP